VRLDSGDLLDLSRQVRRILDENGCHQAKITASSDLNEFAITDLLAAGAPIDSFGVGTDMVTSRDAPALSVVYKMAARREAGAPWRAVVKRSQDKTTLGGRKQVWRHHGPDGLADHDVMGLADERPATEALLRQYIAGGRLVADLPNAPQIADRTRQQIAALPAEARHLRSGYAYTVQISEGLRTAQPRDGR
jgi:nicotinate phosphoribosyltransferase